MRIMARRTKLTKEITDKIIKAIKTGATYELCAQYAGIAPSTFYLWMKQGRERKSKQKIEFLESIKRAESMGAIGNLGLIQKSAQDGDWKASAWILERRHGYKRDRIINQEAQEQSENTFVEKNLRTMLTDQIVDLQHGMKQAKESKSWQAYAALQRQLVTMMQALKVHDAEEGAVDAHERMTDEQLMSEIVNTIIALPPILRQRVQADLHSLVGSNVVALKKA